MKSGPWQPVTCPIAAWDPWAQPLPLRMRLTTGATTGKTTTFEDITFRMIFFNIFNKIKVNLAGHGTSFFERNYVISSYLSSFTCCTMNN